MTTHTDPKARHDFVLLFDVKDGNPNGDPDAGNMPRRDPETNHGIVTDVSLKRKVRDYVHVTKEGDPRFDIYVQKDGVALNTKHQQAYDRAEIGKGAKKVAAAVIDKAREEMCRTYYDVRTFGAVMTTGVNCGQVLGPVQITFARSEDPIAPMDLSITRVAVTKPEDLVQPVSEDGEEGDGQGKVSEMGRKPVVPYGLYRTHGFVTPSHAAKTGFDGADLELFWEALVNMFELDRSSSRGMMACRGLYVFSHDSPLGRAPAHKLFDQITVNRKSENPPRRFIDYEVSVPDGNLPQGVTLTRLEG